MALHKHFPDDPHAILDPAIRRFPADESLRETGMNKLTSGADVDVEPKMLRLRQWCGDVNRFASGVAYDFVYADEGSFKKYSPKSFASLVTSFREFKG